MLREITFTQENNRTPDRWSGLSVLAGKDLTRREQEVWQLMAAGHNDAEIAERLALNPLTVRVHLSNVLDKLGAASRQEATALARRSHAAVDGKPEYALQHA